MMLLMARVQQGRHRLRLRPRRCQKLSRSQRRVRLWRFGGRVVQSGTKRGCEAFVLLAVQKSKPRSCG